MYPPALRALGAQPTRKIIIRHRAHAPIVLKGVSVRIDKSFLEENVFLKTPLSAGEGRLPWHKSWQAGRGQKKKSLSLTCRLRKAADKFL
jgi:hypothetical protein